MDTWSWLSLVYNYPIMTKFYYIHDFNKPPMFKSFTLSSFHIISALSIGNIHHLVPWISSTNFHFVPQIFLFVPIYFSCIFCYFPIFVDDFQEHFYRWFILLFSVFYRWFSYFYRWFSYIFTGGRSSLNIRRGRETHRAGAVARLRCGAGRWDILGTVGGDETRISHGIWWWNSDL